MGLLRMRIRSRTFEAVGVWAVLLWATCGGACDMYPVAPTEPASVDAFDDPSDDQVLAFRPEPPPVQTDPTPLPSVPEVATGLIATSRWTDRVEVTWNDNSANEQGFKVQRQVDNGDWQDYATVNADVYAFIDTAVQPSTEYCYRVSPFNVAGTAEPSPSVCIRLPEEDASPTNSTLSDSYTTSALLAQPDNLELAISSGGQIQLTWADPSAGANGFSVQRYDSADPLGGWREVAMLPAGETQWVDSTGVPGGTYCYRVAGFNAPVTGTYTEPACITVAPTAPAEDPSDQPAGAKILPWLELTAKYLIVEDLWGPIEGSEGRADYGEYCIRGLEHWRKVTDTAIITTHPDNLAGTFEFVMANRPAGMRILGGISTYSLPGGTPSDTRPYDFADTAGWQDIAAEAQHIATVTGNRVVALENEYALTPFHRDGKPIDLQKLGRSLMALRDTGIQFWWYLPSIQANSTKFPNRQQETIQLLATIATALPDCRFIIGYAGYIDWRQNKRTEVIRRQMMVDMLGQSRLLDYMFVTRDGYWYWEDGSSRYCHTSQDAFAEIEALKANWVSIYPGGRNWVTVGREFADQYVPVQ